MNQNVVLNINNLHVIDGVNALLALKEGQIAVLVA